MSMTLAGGESRVHQRGHKRVPVRVQRTQEKPSQGSHWVSGCVFRGSRAQQPKDARFGSRNANQDRLLFEEGIVSCCVEMYRLKTPSSNFPKTLTACHTPSTTFKPYPGETSSISHDRTTPAGFRVLGRSPKLVNL